MKYSDLYWTCAVLRKVYNTSLSGTHWQTKLYKIKYSISIKNNKTSHVFKAGSYCQIVYVYIVNMHNHKWNTQVQMGEMLAEPSITLEHKMINESI